MKTKQEVIQEAWLEFMTESDYKNLKIDENGFCNYQCRRYINSSKWNELYSRIKSGGKTGRDIIYRPKSLTGIEKNNGWTVAESENFPTEGVYNVGRFFDNGDFIYDEVPWQELREYIVDYGYTHYQPIIKPKPPIY